MKFGCINKQLIKLMINIYQWIANWFEWFSERARCLCYYTVHNLYCINSVLIYSESASYPVTQWRNIDDEPAVQKCHSNVAKYRICMSPAVSRRPCGCVDETLNACQFIHGLNEEGNYVKQEFLSEMWILRYIFFGIFFLLSSLALKISETKFRNSEQFRIRSATRCDVALPISIHHTILQFICGVSLRKRTRATATHTHSIS